MKIEKGLKVLSVGKWSAASVFTADNGKQFDVKPNHKIVALDENGEVCNLTFITDVPLTLKAGDILPSICLAGNVSHGSFGYAAKVVFEDVKK